LFINFWYAALRSDQLGEQPVKVRMLGQDFVLFRDAAGQAHCLANTCVHRGGSLGGGKVKGDRIECPYHGWQFDGGGQCTRIPSLGTTAKIPARARVDSYPVVEQYGLVHAFLGDLPEAERPPIMPIPEYGQPGWHATIEEHTGTFDYRRTLENGLDPAHNEFVHTTHGFSGTEGDSRVPDLNVEEQPWGCGFMTTYYSPPLQDERMKAAAGRKGDAVVTAGTFHHGPACMVTRINPGPGYAINQNVYKTPIDSTSVRTFLVQTRSFLLEPEHDGRFTERNKFVREQDLAVLTALQPFFTPETNNHELLMPSDRAVARYREFLQQWEALGWRIDEDALARDGQRVARAIPSPARREQPRGWVLDPVPTVAAEDALTPSSRRSHQKQQEDPALQPR
jgi:phenylpropionate dioxygenase-like ring-hydroxylating dioxygenase large terminal subunit